MNINRSFHGSKSNYSNINQFLSQSFPTTTELSTTSPCIFIGFNEDYQCFFAGTESGFYIYNTHPYAVRFHRELDGGIGIIELLGKSNIVALVGGGTNPKFSPTNVIIWDDFQNKPIAKLEYGSEVKAVRCRSQRILIMLGTKALLYNFSDLHLISQYETAANPLGLCSMVSDDNKNMTIVAIPGCKPGDLRIEIVEAKRSFAIQAHQSALSNIVLSNDGELCATTSDRGTLIRIWNTRDGSLYRELRRGIEPVNILSISFSQDNMNLCLSSDKGTIHVYSLIERNKAQIHEKNKKSTLRFMKNYLPNYFSSEWSQTSFGVPNARKSICGFLPGSSNIIVILTEDGKFYQYRYMPGEDLVQLIKTEKFS
tara:strand:+ start:18700 stop:19806 length:1107 start_codon:yes stop_codon:yes gene_type:complete